MEQFFAWLKYWIAKIIKMFDQTNAWLESLEATEAESTTQG